MANEVKELPQVTLNSTARIHDDAGDYVVLTDYGAAEGFAVHSQHSTLAEGIDGFKCAPQPSVLVKLVWIDVAESQPE